MGLFDGIEEQRSNKGPQCSVARVREQLPPEDAAAFDKVLAMKEIPASVISRRLRDGGHPIDQHVLQRHRRRDCRCPV